MKHVKRKTKTKKRTVQAAVVAAAYPSRRTKAFLYTAVPPDYEDFGEPRVFLNGTKPSLASLGVSPGPEPGTLFAPVRARRAPASTGRVKKARKPKAKPPRGSGFPF